MKHRETVEDGVLLWLAGNIGWCVRTVTLLYTLPPMPIGKSAPVIEAPPLHAAMPGPWHLPTPPETKYSTSITNAINSIVSSSSFS